MFDGDLAYILYVNFMVWFWCLYGQYVRLF